MDNGTISEEVDLSIASIRKVYSVQTIEPISSQNIQSHICIGLKKALPIMSNFTAVIYEKSNFKSSTKTSIRSSASAKASLSVSLCLFSDPGVSLCVLLEEFAAKRGDD